MSDTNFHVGEYIQDELEARGWSTLDCAKRMGGDLDVDALSLDMAIAAASAPPGHAAQRMTIGSGLAARLAIAFGIEAQTLLNLDATYHEKRKAGR